MTTIRQRGGRVLVIPKQLISASYHACMLRPRPAHNDAARRPASSPSRVTVTCRWRFRLHPLYSCHETRYCSAWAISQAIEHGGRPARQRSGARARACAPACLPERTDGARPALHAHTHTKPCRAGWLAARPLSTGGASSLPARLSRRTHGQLNKGPASLRALWWAAVGFSWHGIEIERE